MLVVLAVTSGVAVIVVTIAGVVDCVATTLIVGLAS